MTDAHALLRTRGRLLHGWSHTALTCAARIRLTANNSAKEVTTELLAKLDAPRMDVPQLQAAFRPDAGGIYRVS